MSTYLLLRNNKETGPFTLDELKRMSLKAYDLVWIEGRSAAWRYPGEIPEFSSFAPPAPEQPFDRFYKKAAPESASSVVSTNLPDTALNETSTQAPESGRNTSVFVFPAHPAEGNDLQHLTGNSNRNGGSDSVYIHLPATENKGAGFIPTRRIQEIGKPGEGISAELAYSEKKPQVKRSQRTLLIGSVLLMFCAGLFIGFYISNRRNFYSFEGNSSRVGVIQGKSAEPPAPLKAPDLIRQGENNEQQANIISNASGSALPGASRPKKKPAMPASLRKDSLQMTAPEATAPVGIDSSRIKAQPENEKALLAAKIKSHPEEYLLIGVGNYKIGVLGGISEVPFTLTNRSGADMDLVVIAVDYWLRNKKIFKTENLSFHQVAAGAVVTANAPKSTRGLKISYRLTIANAQQLGMSYSNL